jgi:hypothetical protein
MKRFKYLPYYFLVFLGLTIIGRKFDFVIRGTPIGGHSWNEIWQSMPFNIIFSTVFALYANYLTNDIKKKKVKDLIEAEKRMKEKYHSAPNVHECRVCGCYSVDFPWGEDGKSPTFQLCPCCGVQFGKEDCSLESIKKYRGEWISKGGEWFVKNEKTEGWDMVAQMKNIPDGFR